MKYQDKNEAWVTKGMKTQFALQYFITIHIQYTPGATHNIPTIKGK